MWISVLQVRIPTSHVFMRFQKLGNRFRLAKYVVSRLIGPISIVQCHALTATSVLSHLSVSVGAHLVVMKNPSDMWSSLLQVSGVLAQGNDDEAFNL